MFYGSNLYRKDNPRWVIGNATETPKVPEAAYWLLSPVSGSWDGPVTGLGGSLVARVTRAVCDACGLGVALLIGLPRRVGVRLHATNDAEAQTTRELNQQQGSASVNGSASSNMK